MEYILSRTEKKRLAKQVEKLSSELVKLSAQDIQKLPCEKSLRTEIADAKTMKAGSKKRQIKFIAKELRNSPEFTQPLLDFLETKKGSALKQKREFHMLERYRDDIINEAIHDYEEKQRDEEILLHKEWESPTIDYVIEKFPDLDIFDLKKAAIRYAMTRKPAHSREIFRMLKAAAERLRYNIK